MKQRYEHMQTRIIINEGLDLSPQEDGWELCGVMVTWFNAFEHCGNAYWKRPLMQTLDYQPEQEGKGDFS